MKLPFFKSKPVIITGKQIRSPVAEPHHAKLLREHVRFNATMRERMENTFREIDEVTADSSKGQRIYDGAVTTAYNYDFAATYGSSNAEILTSLYIARGRCRTLVKDYATARGVLRNDVNNVVGDDPFRLEMKVGKWTAGRKKFVPETEINALIQDEWARAAKAENVTVRQDIHRFELLRQLEACVWRDGGVMVRKRRNYPFNKYKFALEVIDIDRLDANWMGKSGTGSNTIRFSIERDQWNRPVAYNILQRHPGDLFQYQGTSKPNTWRERVPAEDIINFQNFRDRAEQDIGFPEMDSIIQALHRDRQFDIAHVTAAIWACCKPFWLVNKGTPNEYAGDVQDAEGKMVSISQPGTGEVLPPGYEPVLTDPKFPIEAAASFKRDNLLQVAQGTGQSYGSVSGDFEKYSFSSARMAQVPERDNYKMRQEHFITAFLEPYFREWLRAAIMSGALKLDITRLDELCESAVFHPKRWPYIQPVQDGQADILLQEAHLKSRQQIISESEEGGTFEDLCAQEAVENEIAESHGINLQVDVSMPVLKKGAPDNPQPNPTDPNAAQPQPASQPQPQKKNGKHKSRIRFGKDGETVIHKNGHLEIET